MSTSWLNKQRKQTLIDLSAEAGLRQSDSLRKEDILTNLHEHLQANSSRLSSHPSFEGYFPARRATPSRSRASLAPPKDDDDDADDAEPEVRSVVKARGRRATKVKQEEADSDSDPTRAGGPQSVVAPSPAIPKVLSSLSKVLSPVVAATTTTTTTSSSSSLARSLLPEALSPATSTPHPNVPHPRRRRSEVPGPASPAQIADAVEESSARLAEGVSALVATSGLGAAVARVREACSSVAGVQVTVLGVEGLALQVGLIPLRRVAVGGGGGEFGVWVPDFFALLAPGYWAATLLWAATSLFVPVAVGYFYNLTLRRVGGRGGMVGRYVVDPVAFNVVKAVGTWAVYQRGAGLGLVGDVAAETVEGAVLGGSTGILIGAAVGVIAALYEAALLEVA